MQSVAETYSETIKCLYTVIWLGTESRYIFVFQCVFEMMDICLLLSAFGVFFDVVKTRLLILPLDKHIHVPYSGKLWRGF